MKTKKMEVEKTETEEIKTEETEAEKIETGKYAKDYSEKSFFDKIKSCFSKAGKSLVYGCLLLFYTLKNPDVPLRVKSIVIAALGYFIAPIDLISDMIPVVGYTDDWTVVLAALGATAIYMNDEIKAQAKEKTRELFKSCKEKDFEAIDSKI